jgi:hypothetical protein
VYLAAHTIGKSVSGGPMARDNWVFVLWRTLHSGTSFERPIIALNADTGATYNLTWNPVVLSNGWLVFPYTVPVGQAVAGATSYRTNVLISRDGGDSFDKAVFVSSAMTRVVPGRTPLQAWNSTAVDASEGPYRDRIYLAWPDQRNGGDSASSEIVVVHSADSGKTWSPPVRVGEYPPRAHVGPGARHITPIIAVNRNGVVGVIWEDRRNFPNDDGYEIRFAASLDGGDTWTPSTLVSEQPMSFAKGQRLLQTTYTPAPTSRAGGVTRPKGRVTIEANMQEWPAGGHSAGFGATGDGRFHAAWVDNRTGIHQIWSATIDVEGAAIVNGAAQLASLRDVTDSMDLVVVSNRWDAKSNAIQMQVRAQNLSKQPIARPLKARIILLESPFGEPVIVGSENGVEGAGAIIDFSALVPENGLAPGASTGIRPLTIRLKDFEPLTIGGRALGNVIRLDARLFSGGGR